MAEKILAVSMQAENRAKLELCAKIMRSFVSILTTQCACTYSRILFPYADMRSVEVAAERGEASLFGTHMLLDGTLDVDMLTDALARACADIIPDDAQIIALSPRICEVEANAQEIARFLCANKVYENTVAAGDFAALLSGGVRAWYIRDRARIFQQVAETAQLREKTDCIGISGGTMLFEVCENAEREELSARLNTMWHDKTGA